MVDGLGVVANFSCSTFNRVIWYDPMVLDWSGIRDPSRGKFSRGSWECTGTCVLYGRSRYGRTKEYRIAQIFWGDQLHYIGIDLLDRIHGGCWLVRALCSFIPSKVREFN